MTGASAVKHAASAPALPRFRAPIVFAFLLLLFCVLLGRSLYLQWIDNAFLQEQGTSRYSREIELPRIAAASSIAPASRSRSRRR
jgi:cell division protein FtsI (penicillin-binding protein 3)